MSVLFALSSAIVFGAGDFLGGLATRRTPAWSVVLGAQAAGLVLLVVSLPLLPDATVTPADLAWGAAAGLAGAVAFTQFFRGLSIGPMSVVAPVAAVVNVVVPVIVGVLGGERPSALAWVGVALAVPSIALVAYERGTEPGDVGAALVAAVVAGLGFGTFFVFLDRTGENSGIVPLVSARGASMTVLLVIGLSTGRLGAVPADRRRMVAGSGVLDMSANVLFLLAVRDGLLTIGAVVSSMYPASTILLARAFLGETIGRVRVLGLVLAAAAVAIVAVG